MSYILYVFRIITEVTKLITGALMFISALTWRDVIKNYLEKNRIYKGDSLLYYAFIVSIISVVFVIVTNSIVESLSLKYIIKKQEQVEQVEQVEEAT